MKIRMVTALQDWMQIPMCSVLAESIRIDISQPTLRAVVVVQVLQVLELAVSQSCSCIDEGIFSSLCRERALGDMNGSLVAVVLFFSLSMVCLKL